MASHAVEVIENIEKFELDWDRGGPHELVENVCGENRKLFGLGSSQLSLVAPPGFGLLEVSTNNIF